MIMKQYLTYTDYALWEVIVNDKTGLGYDSQLTKKDLSNKSDVFESAYDSSVNESEEDTNQANDRYKAGEGYRAVPPPSTRNFMPLRSDLSFVGNFVPTAVITNSRKVPVNAAMQSSSRVSASTSTTRYVNTIANRPTVNGTKPSSNVFHKSHSPVRREMGKMLLSPQHAGFGDQHEMVLIISPKTVDHTCLKDLTMLIFNADSSQIMMGNKSFLTDYQEIDGGFVAFGGSPKGGKISGKEINANARKARQEKASDHEYILLPFMPLSTQSSDDEDAGDVPDKGDEGVSKGSGIDDQKKTDSSTQDVGSVKPSFNTTSTNINTGSLNINIVGSNDLSMPSWEETGIFNDVYDDRKVGIEAIKIFLAYASFMRFIMYQMDVNSAFLYGTIEEEVYVCKPLGFEDPHYPNKVYKTTSTLMEPNKTLIKDVKAKDVDVHLYRSMIGSLMYLTTSRPNIMFVICACARLWYPKDSPFDLEAFYNSDYAGASIDRKSIIGGCQFLGKRLILWQCKKQTIVANSTIDVEYVVVDRHTLTAATHKLMVMVTDVGKQALVDEKKVVVNEASIRHDIRLDDAERTACLPNAAIFEELARMGYKKPSQKLTFYKAFFHHNENEKKVVVNEASIRHDIRLDDAEGTACLPNAAIFEELARMGVLSLEQTNTNQAAKIEKLNKRGMINDQDLFGVHDLDGGEVFVDVTAGENVEPDAIVAEKAKDKGKGIIVEPKKPLKKKDQIVLDEEVARKLEANIKAKIDEEERMVREKNEANIAVIEEWDDVQATIDADK
nr:hypothetical protein [Tanacetum cinerariifolium]